MREKLLRAREWAGEAVAWTGGLEFPDFERDVELVSLREPGDTRLTAGASSRTGAST